MDLLGLFLFTESILAIILSFFFVGLFIALLSFVRAINEMKRKVNLAADEVINTAEETKTMAEKLSRSITDYFVIKITNILNKKGRRGGKDDGCC